MILQTDFNTIKPLWQNLEMWGNIDVKPVSSIKFYDGKKYFGGNDMSVYDISISQPKFYVYCVNNIVVGCLSYHLIDKTIRSRGLFVVKEYRGQKIAEKLLNHVIEECLQTRPESFIWAMAGPNSMRVHSKFNFEQVTKQFKDVLPDNNKTIHNNCYMRLVL